VLFPGTDGSMAWHDQRCHARKSLHDNEFCRAHRIQTDRKNIRAAIKYRPAHNDGLLKALQLMNKIEEQYPDDSAIECWDRLRNILTKAVK
jgi:hypothetical protein